MGGVSTEWGREEGVWGGVSTEWGREEGVWGE